jgi:hypothetical protein
MTDSVIYRLKTGDPHRQEYFSNGLTLLDGEEQIHYKGTPLRWKEPYAGASTLSL